ncbi:MAG: protein kinase domain-containing protein [Rubrobacteraceae bacterium]
MEKLANRFVLEREVGSGGMSTVYLGHDEVLGRAVAVKVLKSGFADTDMGDRFQREGKTAARLAHPNIVPVYDAGEGEMNGREISYIVMEHVPGGDLKDLLDRNGPLEIRRLSRVGAEVAGGLAHAHERGVIHRDIKPHNILLDEHGRPKLTDFGIARALESTRVTRTGSYLGTALYSSPEQLQGRDVTTKSDVYSLGATLYQAATGVPPFQGSPFEVADQHLKNRPRPPGELNPGLNKDLESLILSCLAKDPEERPSAREVSSRLATMADGASPYAVAAAAGAGRDRVRPTRQQSVPRTPDRRGNRSRGIFAALAVVAVLALIAAMVGPALLGGSPEEDTASRDAPAQEDQAVEEGRQDAENRAPQSQDDAGNDQEVAEAPAEPPEEPPDELSEEAAAGVVEGFYTTAAEGDYGTSAELLSEGYSATFPNEATFEGTFETLESIEFVEGPTVEISNDTATVTGVTEAVHTDRTELNTAAWTLVDEGGEWKLDDIVIQDTRII